MKHRQTSLLLTAVLSLATASAYAQAAKSSIEYLRMNGIVPPASRGQ